MNVEKELKEIRIACMISDWFSVEQHVDYDFDLSLPLKYNFKPRIIRMTRIAKGVFTM